MRVISNRQNNPLRRPYFTDFSGACNDAVRPCNAQFMADLADINATAPGSDRDNKVNKLTEKMAKCLGQNGWPCKKVSKDSVKFDATGDTMDLIASSGSGSASFQCLVTAGPWYDAQQDGNGGNGGGGGIVPTQEVDIANWLSNNWYIPVGGILLLAFVFFMMRRNS